jgi:hypothetical protein
MYLRQNISSFYSFCSAIKYNKRLGLHLIYSDAISYITVLRNRLPKHREPENGGLVIIFPEPKRCLASPQNLDSTQIRPFARSHVIDCILKAGPVLRGTKFGLGL